MQETDQILHAPKAFQKAVILKPNQILAWQGLATYYEKDGVEKNFDHMLEVYENILSLESDIVKWMSTFIKFTDVVLKTNKLDTFIKVVDTHKQCKLPIPLRDFWQGVTKVLKNTTSQLDRQHYDLLLEGLTFVEGKNDACQQLFDLLLLKKDLDNLVHYANNCDVNLANIVLNVYGRLYVEKPESISAVHRSWVRNFLDKINGELTEFQLLCKASVLMDSSQFSEARDLLESYFTPDNKSLWHGHILLGQAHLKLLSYEEVEMCVKVARSCNSKSKFQDHYDYLLLQAVVHSQEEDKNRQGLDIGKRLFEKNLNDPVLLECMARASINLRSWYAAEKLVKKLEDMDDKCQFTAALLRVEMAKVKSEPISPEQLQSLAEKYPESAEVWYLVGMHNIKEDKMQDGISCLFKAAKLAPNCYKTFFQLGLYYKSINDLGTARRCLKKALYLNRRSDEVAVTLSDVFIAQADYEANKELLNAIVKNTGRKWACVRLGVQYSTENDVDSAVKCLRAALRHDPTDSECWEVLADSYLARGSYTSAMKSYQKVLELKPGSLYPAVQIAGVKLLLDEPNESRKEFKQLAEDSPKNILVLKGLAEACLGLAKQHHFRRQLGLARDSLEEAIITLSSALIERRDLSCLWKLMGDVLIQASLLPKSWSFLHVPVWIHKKDINIDKEEKILLKGLALCELSTRCFSFALKLMDKIGCTSLLWHDLAASYFRQSQLISNGTKRRQLVQNSFFAIKKSVTYDPSNWEHWNLLGIIASCPDINEKPLAQHSFIQSILAEDRNSVAWTNLGVLYLELNHSDLANKSFNATQRIDDSYYQSWIGQAMIAEKIKHADTLDLFRHTTQLGFHPESAISYAQHVLHTLQMDITCDEDREYYKDSITDMFAEAVASEGMTWYTEERDTDSCGHNMLGCLQERLGWLNSAIKSFTKALSLLEQEKENYSLNKKKVEEEEELQKLLTNQRISIVRKNLARVMIKVDRNEEAISLIHKIEDSDFQTDCNLALALFKRDQLDECIRQYERITTKYSLSNGKYDKLADVMIAKAAAFYKKDDADSTLKNLKQCRMLQENSNIQCANGMFAEFAFHMLGADLESAKEVLELVKPLGSNPEYITDISTFDAYISFIEEDYDNMIWTLAKSVHSRPGLASLRFKLAIIIVEKFLNSSSCSRGLVGAAARMANLSIKMARGTNMNMQKILPIASVAHLLSGNVKDSLTMSQQAVHLYPNVAEGWAVFLASAIAMQKPTDLLMNILARLRFNVDSTNYLSDWVNSIEPMISS
ncbi:tetratricopeptide repeat protein 37 isoform X2 [Nilaparvata lugens]|nr:tetratricopeptide repeat protein 37 isoform X2 [Nilaparvata lugens]